ncbi:hypothetical protein [Natrialba asiatica]|uniref:Uncharacterized protein n=1 Tax=Natrialba asiatica (strain ATCC 700177 / DSM 12278 / JCM 9576 / FERM P-10747 / NBRC 102637 / 172P1) TaxID=29540 RepID=M0AT88_NATA1|nr:hypothetical protein [Natrialba asiatica]ELZ01926.1 hypothetical protein C481_08683 [Natrialba asiatica DSM 12278]
MERSGTDTPSGEPALGVKTLAGVTGLCAFVVAGFGMFSIVELEPRLASRTLLSLVVPALLLGFGLGVLVLAAGLWSGLYWAWSWMVLLYTGSTFGGLAAGITTGDLSALGSAVGSGLIAAYLYRHRNEFNATNR